MSSHAIELTRITAAYDRTPILRDVSLYVPPGQFTGLIGPSGAGKTTLLRAMLGLVPRVEGDVSVGGRRVVTDRAPKGVGYVPQVGAIDWSFPVTVENVVMMGISNQTLALPWPSRQERRKVHEVLERLGLQGFESRHIRDLSGGQQQRAFLARALVSDPEILILDEPTASVDIKTRDDILHLLSELNRDGTTIVMTTHELNSVAAHLPWVVCVNGGIVAQGPPQAVFSAEIISKTFNAEMRVIRDDETGAWLVAEAGAHRPFSLDSDQLASVA
ncbi:metal ABC transporter ATP-binding protein [soil metagenome]